ncbi:MAG TPA: hypothetical protein VIK71_07425 [Flavobacteriales bacterium]|jgi:hypothetical protein
MKTLDPKYLNTRHLAELKAGTKLVLRNHLQHIEQIVYRGYVASAGYLNSPDTVIIRLLFEHHSRIGLQTVCCSMYDDEDGYFTSVGNGTRYEILEVIEPEFEVRALVLSEFRSGIPWLSHASFAKQRSVA